MGGSGLGAFDDVEGPGLAALGLNLLARSDCSVRRELALDGQGLFEADMLMLDMEA